MGMDGMVGLSVETLPGLSENVEEQMKLAVADVIARPELQKARVVRLEISITPAVEPSSGRNWPDIDAKVSSKLPANVVPSAKGIVDAGQILISQVDAQNPAQGGLPGVVAFEDAKNKKGNGG